MVLKRTAVRERGSVQRGLPWPVPHFVAESDFAKTIGTTTTPSDPQAARIGRAIVEAQVGSHRAGDSGVLFSLQRAAGRRTRIQAVRFSETRPSRARCRHRRIRHCRLRIDDCESRKQPGCFQLPTKQASSAPCGVRGSRNTEVQTAHGYNRRIARHQLTGHGRKLPACAEAHPAPKDAGTRRDP